jgi:signal transduction histidine kinase
VLAAAAALAPTPADTAVQRLLVVEDNPADAELVVELFANAPPGEPTVVECVERIGRAATRLAETHFDAVLLDLSLPDASGLEGLARIAAVAPDVPIVVMTGCTDEGTAMAAVKAGAQDYLVKGEDGPRIVRRAVRYAIERQRRRAEREALLASERAARGAAERSARLRDEVLGIVSHDLRDPLSRIVMAGRGIADRSMPDTPVLARLIVRSGELALRIIRDLLDATAIEAGRLAVQAEPVPVETIEDAIDAMFCDAAAHGGLHWAVERAGAPFQVVADVDRLVQALGNLVANAIKFTPRGGRVTLTVTGDAHEARFRVADTGPGIAAEHLPQLFDRFWQAHASRRAGAGLGLAIARGIAESHGGRIEVESELGKGSAFTLVLPATHVTID